MVKERDIRKTDQYKILMEATNLTLAKNLCKNNEYEKGLKLYENSMDSKDVNILDDYVKYSLEYASKLAQEKKWVEAAQVYKKMAKYKNFPLVVYKNLGLCMKALENPELALEFFKTYEKASDDKKGIYEYIADVLYGDFKKNAEAIEYYEKALEYNKDNYTLYNMLGHLYSTEYQDKYKEKQIEYLTKAYELAPDNRIVVKNLAYVYGKFHEEEKADEFYSKLMYLNPTHSDLHSYGAYLVRHKRFREGFKFLQHRFQKEDLGNIGFPEVFKDKSKKWNSRMKLDDKHVLIHFEQGFGDSIMFVRFANLIKNKCKKLSVVVQPSLLELFKDSKLGLDLYTEEEAKALNYDCVIPMMDLPILCKTTPETIPYAEGYLSVPKAKVDEYRKANISRNNKFKIGIAYEGTLSSKETDRDIPLNYLYPLMQIPNVEVYSFQVDDLTSQMDEVPEEYGLMRLGKTFKNWEDTACAMNCMDLMVTTDNGVMNLAGALGVKTFGLFNKITEWRWFKTEGEDIAWYKSIKPYQCPTSRAWEVPVKEIEKEVRRLINDK